MTATPDRTATNIVVTGGSSGIGAAIAAIEAGRGATVTVLDHREPEASGYAFVQADLADPASIDGALERLPSRIEAHYNVAGIPGTHPDESVLRVNFLGLRQLTEALIRRIPAGGCVVNVASVAGIGYPGRLELIRELITTDSFAAGLEWFRKNAPEGATYNFTKEVLIVYTQLLSARLARRGNSGELGQPGPGADPDPGRFRGVDGQGRAGPGAGNCRSARRTRRHRSRRGISRLR